MRWLTLASVWCAVACSGRTQQQQNNCTGGTVDAGPNARARYEPCHDGAACASGLTCSFLAFVDDTVEEECGDGTAQVCAVDGDCGGRFVRKCAGSDGGTGSGACRLVACSGVRSVACPTGATCMMPVYCCPPGAPCVAPPDGACLR